MIVSALESMIDWSNEMREKQPIFYDPEYKFSFGVTGGWQVFRYQDVKSVLADPTTFSSGYLPKTGGLYDNILAVQDPPYHTKLRSVIQKSFAPGNIAALKPWIRNRSIELLSPHIPTGEIDFVSSFAKPLPLETMAQLLGAPVTYYDNMQQMTEFLNDLIEKKRDQIRPGIIEQLINNQELTKDEILSFCFILIVAGFKTTVSWMSGTMMMFIEYPHLLSHVQHFREDLPKMLNETLRFWPPVINIPRIVKKDCLLGTHKIAKGEIVNLWILAANRDPAIFDDPDRFDIQRNNSQTISFGYGIHACIGAALARMEIEAAMDVFISNIEDVRLKEGVQLELQTSDSTNSLKNLPIKFSLKREMVKS